MGAVPHKGYHDTGDFWRGGRGVHTGPARQHCELAPNHPVPRSLWLPNELAVVAVLAVIAEMGQAAARALCRNP